MKSMIDIKQDMSTVFDECRQGVITLEMTAELSNVTGKYLKAEALILAREMFMESIKPTTGKRRKLLGASRVVAEQ